MAVLCAPASSLIATIAGQLSEDCSAKSGRSTGITQKDARPSPDATHERTCALLFLLMVLEVVVGSPIVMLKGQPNEEPAFEKRPRLPEDLLAVVIALML